MQTLLTKGIGHKEFKETPIGKIPKTWQAIKFKDILELPLQSGIYKPRQFYGSGVKIVRMTELFKNDILDVETNMRKVTVTPHELNKYSLKDGDLLFARRSLKVEGSGKCVLVPKVNEPIVFESSIIRASLKKEIAYPLFYLYYMNSLGHRQIVHMVRTVAVSGISGRDLKNLNIPLPPIEEQKKISLYLRIYIICGFLPAKMFLLRIFKSASSLKLFTPPKYSFRWLLLGARTSHRML